MALKEELRAYPGWGISLSDDIQNNARDGFRLGSPKLSLSPRDTRLDPRPELLT